MTDPFDIILPINADLTTYDGCIAAIAASVDLDPESAARVIRTAEAAVKAISARDKAINDTKRTEAMTKKERALTGATKALLELAARNPNAEVLEATE